MVRAVRWPPGSARRGRRGAAGVRRWGGRGARRWRPRRWPGAADLQPRWVRRLAAGRAPRCAPPCPCWRARRAAAPAPRPRRRGRPPGAPADPGGPARRPALRAPPKAPSAARSPSRAAQPGPPSRPWFRRAHSLSSRRGGKVGRCSRRRFRPQDGSDRKPALRGQQGVRFRGRTTCERVRTCVSYVALRPARTGRAAAGSAAAVSPAVRSFPPSLSFTHQFWSVQFYCWRSLRADAAAGQLH